MRRREYTISPNRIFYQRKQLGLTQAEVATLMALEDGSMISEYERGTTVPSVVRAMELAFALNLSVELLFLDTAREIQKDVNRRRDAFRRKRA